MNICMCLQRLQEIIGRSYWNYMQLYDDRTENGIALGHHESLGF